MCSGSCLSHVRWGRPRKTACLLTTGNTQQSRRRSKLPGVKLVCPGGLLVVQVIAVLKVKLKPTGLVFGIEAKPFQDTKTVFFFVPKTITAAFNLTFKTSSGCSEVQRQIPKCCRGNRAVTHTGSHQVKCFKFSLSWTFFFTFFPTGLII